MNALEQEFIEAETHLHDMVRAANDYARYCSRLHAQVRDGRLNHAEWIAYLDGLCTLRERGRLL